MARRRLPDGAPVGRFAVPRRPALLAGALVATAGLADVLSYLGLETVNPYVVMTGQGMVELRTTGWTRAHLLAGVAVLLTGLLLATGRTWAVLAGLGVVTGAIALDAMFLPFDPLHGVLALGLHLGAVTILLRNRGAPARRPG
ncbi:DUF7144 family membrane protein [Micromonospora siamensis]|uniref:DUF7144 domain-containing protein n=1 Tax=Micromonospora siamensis TaxID=299152 RepID=A0A1C5HTP2_9ACTN|nr:hypothetical protein [Micromonospora siamensis]SCG49379.1 hypothetical protein GA0074704_2337 [Micromonospora siamensis]